MKVLVIGQLPKEIGGNYTTGAANVVYELSKQKQSDVIVYTYGTNLVNKQAVSFSKYPHQYIGYVWLWYKLFFSWLLHPVETMRQWTHYLKIDHNNPIRFAFYKANIERAIDIVNPDLIHVHSINNLSSTFFARGKRKVPILLTCHGIFYRGDKEDKKGHDLYLGNISFADAYTGLTDESLKEYENILGVPIERVSVIPNGVDCEKFFYSKSKREEIRALMKVPAETVVLITVASVQERKGQLAFIKLLESIKINYQYWIIGSGPDSAKVQDYINKHGLIDKVKMLGFHSTTELYGFYSAADVYAHVSTAEGQALCEIEAYATGLRTIVDKRVSGTIPDLSLGDYYILDQENINITDLTSWLLIRNIPRDSRINLDWQQIREKYDKLYKTTVSQY